MCQCVQIACKVTQYVTLFWAAWKGFEVSCRSLFFGLCNVVFARAKIYKQRFTQCDFDLLINTYICAYMHVCIHACSSTHTEKHFHTYTLACVYVCMYVSKNFPSAILTMSPVQILWGGEEGAQCFWIKDCGSTHGTFVNGTRLGRVTEESAANDLEKENGHSFDCAAARPCLEGTAEDGMPSATDAGVRSDEAARGKVAWAPLGEGDVVVLGGTTEFGAHVTLRESRSCCLLCSQVYVVFCAVRCMHES